MGIASGLRWAFPWLERFYNRMYPSFDERWENYDKATRDSLVEIEEKALRRAKWKQIIQNEGVPKIVMEREMHKRKYQKTAEKMQEWAQSPYDPTLTAIKWGEDEGRSVAEELRGK